MQEKSGYIYILANRRNGTLYIGVTSDLNRRIMAHRTGSFPGFAKKYNLKRLVYVESFPTAKEAILREKQMKAWKRSWKIQLIERANPHWRDLFNT